MSDEKPLCPMNIAREIWEAHPNPTIRAVAKAIEEAGYSCSISTIQRWRKNGWAIAPRAPGMRRAVYDKAVEVIVKTDQEVVDAAAELREIKDDNELGRLATRESLIAQILLSREVAKRAHLLAETSPAKVAAIIDALKGESHTMVVMVPPAPANGDDAKLVNGNTVEPSASATKLKILEFQKRRRQEQS